MSNKNRASKNTGTGKPGVTNMDARDVIPSFEKGGVVSGDITSKFIEPDQPEAIFPLDKLKSLIDEAEKDTPGCEPIGRLRWGIAQAAEREQHTLGYIEGALHYGKAYKHYFHFVGLGNDLHGLNVIEIGPADFPALQHCSNFNGVIIEPMPSEHLAQICKEKGITLVDMPFEDVDETRFQGAPGVVEVWLFNVMQHVIDPAAFIAKVKLVADRVRFFEPINEPITAYHPHTYTLEDFQNWFGGSVNLYAGGSVEGFHEADCAYGCWIK